jgi:hypothetical protein
MSAYIKTILKILTFSFCVISCQNTNNRDIDKMLTFDLKELPEIRNVKLSEIGFVDIEYIPLETTKNSIIPIINELRIGDGFFLAQFFNSILMFRSDGTFVTKIGTEGRGPNEFTVAHDVDIDSVNHKIYIVSGWQKKFYVYSKDGELIRTFHCPLNTTNFKITEYGILCYSINSFANVETSYNLIDTGGRVIKTFPNMYHWDLKKQFGTAPLRENLFYSFKRRLIKKEIYSDTVYVFENLCFKPYLVIKHGKKLLTTQARSDFEPIHLLDNFIAQNNLFEFDNYIYYEFCIGPTVYSLICSTKNDFHVLVDPEKNIINDLDGGPNIWPKTIKDDNTLVGWIDAMQLKAHVVSEAFKNSKPKYPEKKKELIKLADSLKETDNPVLMLVRLKK